MSETPLKHTPLDSLHRSLGAKMVPFAGYEMPIQYADGIVAEHNHTRAAAGLFDVSHMGQARLEGREVIAAFEKLVPGEIAALKPGRMRYTQLTNDEGGILDDLMVTRLEDMLGDERLFLVVNAACKDADFQHIGASLGNLPRLEVLETRALLALQGPKAIGVMAEVLKNCADTRCTGMSFMSMREIDSDFGKLFISRCGYTGEDGFEISVEASKAEGLARALLQSDDVRPIGLGARDTLRLEAGLCLYGHDIDTATTPIEAGLIWSIGKRRRLEGGFAGADVILKQIADGPSRKLVGLLPDGRAPAREGTEITSPDGAVIGKVTSGGFGPTLGGPLAMGYVASEFAAPGTGVNLMVRGKALPARVAAMPFVPNNYYRP
ncbi:MAG: glycine cleavage system protein T [Hyphomicrobiales bacterium]|nr:MAG: glycine cleavage system protein T [Hyphomicrobiales bacterium]